MSNAEPFYIEGSSGKLFTIYHRAQCASRGTVLYAPPFAEEMNRSRLVVACQARQFAEAGFDVLLVDYYGTGDSEGEFWDANLDIWIRDFSICLDWLIAKGATNVYIWGLRFGCLLAAIAVSDRQQNISGWIFWEPVTDGEEIVKDLLRMERISQILAAGNRNSLEEGDTGSKKDIKEIAGYQISIQFLEQLKLIKYDNFAPNNLTVYYVHAKSEIAKSKDRPREGRDGIVKIGLNCVNVTDNRFWLTPEIMVANHLLELTTSNLLASVA